MSLRRRSITYSGAPPPTFLVKPTTADFVVTTSSGGSHNHSGLSFGPASANRALIASVNTGISPSSLTIGGVAATRVVRQSVSGQGSAELWIALVPSGTSGNVVLPNQSAGYISAVALYAVINLRSLTAFDTAGDSGNPSVSMSLSVPGQGVAIASIRASGSPIRTAWSGVSEDFDSVLSGRTISSGGSYSATSATTRSITATITNDSLFTAASCAASFR